MIKETLEGYGFVFSETPVSTATYLMDDGSFMDTVSMYRDGLFEPNAFDSPLHPQIDAFVGSVLHNHEKGLLMSEYGAIRLRDGKSLSESSPNSEIGAAYIEASVGVASAQAEPLRQWLDMVMAGKGMVIVYKGEEEPKEFELKTSGNISSVIAFLR